MQSFDTSLRNNLFVLDYEPERKVIYAPIQGQAFFCGASEAKEVGDYIAHGIQPKASVLNDYLAKIDNSPITLPKDTPAIDTKDRLVVILSQVCNMACSYCFAQESRSSRVLDKTILLSAIDNVFSQGNSVKVFTFIGGGEPFVTWDLLKIGIENIERCSKDKGIEYSIRLITNGTLIDNERAAFLSRYHVSVSLSFEILPDVQDAQRPLHLQKKSSFETICKGLDILREHHIPFGFRSTITSVNVNRMSEMVKYALEHFPEVSKLHFEPVTAEGLGYSFYQDYIHAFMEAFAIGDKENVFVTNSFINSYFKIKNRFCQGELCITPTGDFVVCHRHSSANDKLFNAFRIGKADYKEVALNPYQIKSVTAIWNDKYKDCENCMAKWHCAGKCSSIRKSLSPDENTAHCRFIRDLLTQFIAYNLKH